MTEKKFDPKIYVLLFILSLFLLLGTWKCFKYQKKIPAIEIVQENKNSQLEESSNEPSLLLDTPALENQEVVEIKEGPSLPKSIIEKKPSEIKSNPPPIEHSPTIKQEEEMNTIEKEDISEKEVIDQEQTIQKINEKVKPTSTVNLKSSCTYSSVLKIDRPYYQLCVAISPDGANFVSGNSNAQANIYNLDGKEITNLIGHKSHVSTAAYSPNGRYIATGSTDKTAKLWNAKTGEILKNFIEHSEAVAVVAFSPDGKQLLTGSKDHNAILWDVNSGKKLLHLQGHKEEIVEAAFSLDGKIIFTGGVDSKARLWDARSGKTIQTIEGYKGSISSVVFTPNRKFLLTGNTKGIVNYWNIKTGKRLRTIKCHKEEIRSLSISSDGQFFLTASGDNTMKLWQTLNGKELCQLKGHSSEIPEAVFHPINNNIIISSSIDKTIRIWKTILE